MEGEGVANFARAFQHAGAQSVVVSLWAVASDEAVEYMTLFYGHLKEGKPALRPCRWPARPSKPSTPNPSSGRSLSSMARGEASYCFYDPTLITGPKTFHNQTISNLFNLNGPLPFPPVTWCSLIPKSEILVPTDVGAR